MNFRNFSLNFLSILICAGWVLLASPAHAYTLEERRAILRMMENSQDNITKLEKVSPAIKCNDPFMGYQNYLEIRLNLETPEIKARVKSLLAHDLQREVTSGFFDAGFGMLGNRAAILIKYPKVFFQSWSYFHYLAHEIEHAIQAFQALPEYQIADKIFPNYEVINPVGFFQEANAIYAEHRFLQFADKEAIENEIATLESTKFIQADEKQHLIRSLKTRDLTSSSYLELQWNTGRYALEQFNIYEQQPSFYTMMKKEYCDFLLEAH